MKTKSVIHAGDRSNAHWSLDLDRDPRFGPMTRVELYPGGPQITIHASVYCLSGDYTKYGAYTETIFSPEQIEEMLVLGWKRIG